MITIFAATIVYGRDRLVRCKCRMLARTPLGDAQMADTVTLVEAQALPMNDWTDADLCAAVAAKLGVPVADVSIDETGV